MPSRWSFLALTAALCVGCAGVTDTTSGGAQAESVAAKPAPITNFVKVREGLYRGAHPDAAGLDYLKSIGVKTIIDLEVADLIEAWPSDISTEVDEAAQRGIHLVREPMSAFEPAVSDRFDARIDEILGILKNSDDAPVYVHCKHGQDRTGLVIGLERVLIEGWQPKDAYDEMVRIGFHPYFIGLSEYFDRKTGWEDD